jgi:hypothetical protein
MVSGKFYAAAPEKESASHDRKRENAETDAACCK